jgi:hypothetical protein
VNAIGWRLCWFFAKEHFEACGESEEMVKKEGKVNPAGRFL